MKKQKQITKKQLERILKLNKKIWGYDTFDGFVKNSFTDNDIDIKTGKKVN